MLSYPLHLTFKTEYIWKSLAGRTAQNPELESMRFEFFFTESFQQNKVLNRAFKYMFHSIFKK